MPGMDGYQATAEIRKREGTSAHTMVVALTAHATEGDRELCMSAGMDGYVTKPVKMTALAEALDGWTDCGARNGSSLSPASQKLAGAENEDERLDPASLDQIAELGDDLLGQLVRNFLSDFDGRIASMQDALEARDLPRLASIAHFFKSASATLGAKRFSALCAKIEARPRAGNEAETISASKDLIVAAQSLPAMLTGAAAESATHRIH